MSGIEGGRFPAAEAPRGMAATASPTGPRLAADDVLAHYRNMVSHFCCAGGLRGNLSKFFHYMAGQLPCTRMACVMVDRTNRHVLPLAEWTASPDLRLGASRPDRMPSLEALEAAIGFPSFGAPASPPFVVGEGGVPLDLGGDWALRRWYGLRGEDDALKTDDAPCLAARQDDYTADKRSMAFWGLLDGPLQRAGLVVRLYRMPQRMTLFLADAPEPGAFTEADAVLAAHLCEPLRNMFAWLPLSSSRGDLPILPEVDKTTAYDMLKRCPSLAVLVRQVEGLAATDATVLVQGESGVGKELVADSLHGLSSRRHGPFVTVNCAALPENLAESLFFGHERGAFTGAAHTHVGFFEQAHGGTLFLDEVGELTLLTQARLLRVLETQSFRRVGGMRELSADVRLVAATNRDLKEMVRRGTFREDLFYRLYVYPLTIPPLRERREDIAPLIQYFYSDLIHRRGMGTAPPISMEQVADLCLRSWPGNVRQLRNVLERSLLEAVISRSAFVNFTRALQDDDPTYGLEALMSTGGTLKEVKARAIAAALKESKGRIQGEHGAATRLGLSPNTLRARMRELGIPLPRELRKKKTE